VQYAGQSLFRGWAAQTVELAGPPHGWRWFIYEDLPAALTIEQALRWGWSWKSRSLWRGATARRR